MHLDYLPHHCVTVQSMRNLLGMMTSNSLLAVVGRAVGHRMECRKDFVCWMLGEGRHFRVMNNRYYMMGRGRMMCRGHMKYLVRYNLCWHRIPLGNIVDKRFAVAGSRFGFVKVGRP